MRTERALLLPGAQTMTEKKEDGSKLKRDSLTDYLFLPVEFNYQP
jgi:hypothetical protein